MPNTKPSKVDDIIRHIENLRNVGVPDDIIFNTLQIAIIEYTDLEMRAAMQSSKPKPAAKPAALNRIGFTR